MSEQVKIDAEVKERLDEIKDLPRFKYAEPSYSGCIEYLLDAHDGETTPSGGEVDSDDTEDSFRGDDEQPNNNRETAEEKVNRIKVDD